MTEASTKVQNPGPMLDTIIRFRSTLRGKVPLQRRSSSLHKGSSGTHTLARIGSGEGQPGAHKRERITGVTEERKCELLYLRR